MPGHYAGLIDESLLTVADILLPDVLDYQIRSSASYGSAVRYGRGSMDNVPEWGFHRSRTTLLWSILDRRS
jgi:hypothetical protein